MTPWKVLFIKFSNLSWIFCIIVIFKFVGLKESSWKYFFIWVIELFSNLQKNNASHIRTKKHFKKFFSLKPKEILFLVVKTIARSNIKTKMMLQMSKKWNFQSTFSLDVVESLLIHFYGSRQNEEGHYLLSRQKHVLSLKLVFFSKKLDQKTTRSFLVTWLYLQFAKIK